MTECGHTFCTDCIFKHIDLDCEWAPPGDNGLAPKNMNCPLCRFEFHDDLWRHLEVAEQQALKKGDESDAWIAREILDAWSAEVVRRPN